MICSRCEVEKDESAFPASHRKPGSTRKVQRRMCQACRNEADYEKHARWKLANPDKVQAIATAQYARQAAVRRARWRDDPEYRAANRVATAAYRAKNGDRLRTNVRERQRATRRAVLELLYGNKCACCGEWHPEFLAIDHVDGGGTAARKLEQPSALYRRLVAIGEPLSDYRILCHNCNMAFGFYGSCPHNV